MIGGRRLILLSAAAVAAGLGPGIEAPGPWGLDALSAATPGHVAVIGAATPSGPGAPESATAADLGRGAIYLSGGLHRAIDPSSERILVRPGHGPMDARATALHAQVVAAVVKEVAGTAPEAGIGLLLGGVPGTAAEPAAGLAEALAALREDPELAGVALEILDLREEELEETQVPGGGSESYAMAISVLECDALVNIARPGAPLAGLDNLRGLAGPVAGGAAPGAVDLILLAEVDYTLLDMTAHEGAPGGSLVLAGADGIAVDRAAAALLGVEGESLSPLVAAGGLRIGVSILANIKVAGLEVPGSWTPPPDTTGVEPR